MLRAYFLLLVCVGVTAALVGRFPETQNLTRLPERHLAVTAPLSSVAGPEAQTINALDQSIELTRGAHGYFYADVQINGAPIHMIVDTGANVIALSRDDAQMAGIATPIAMNDVVGQGADGEVKGVEVTLDRVTLGGKTVEKLPAIILNSGGQSLLGQTFLSQFASVQIQGDKMILR